MTDLTAYDLHLRAIATFRQFTKERIFAALELLEQAIAIDPHYGRALSLAAVCHLRVSACMGFRLSSQTNAGVQRGC